MQPLLELQHSRTLLLEGLEQEQIEALGQAEVWVIGLGGLGATVSLYLASAGVGRLHLVDPDQVELSNLPRQVLYGSADLERMKAEIAAERLQSQHPALQVVGHVERADLPWLEAHLTHASLVLDCTDRSASRHAINQFCSRRGIPLVIASVVRWEGQLLVCSPSLRHRGCYACSFPPAQGSAPSQLDAACGAFGVFPTMAGLMALLQAQEGLQILLGLAPEEDLLLVQGPRLELMRIQRAQVPGCPACSESDQAR